MQWLVVWVLEIIFGAIGITSVIIGVVLEAKDNDKKAIFMDIYVCAFIVFIVLGLVDKFL